MNTEIIKTAKPTEYKGVTFRSKSEAMFAYCLDKFGLSYEYEPKIECNNLEWTPDFLINEKRTGAICLLEYKPSDPTSTYIKWIKSEWNKVKKLPLNKLGDSSEGFVDCAFLVKHNFYNRDDVRIITSDEWPENLISRLITDKFISSALYYFSEQALNYRFDLQHCNLSNDFQTKKDPLPEDPYLKSDYSIQYEKRKKLGIPEREYWLLKLLFKYNNQIDWVVDVFKSSWITHPLALSAIECVIQAHRNGSWQGGQSLLNRVAGFELEELVAIALSDTTETPNIEKQLPDTLTYLRNQWLRNRICELSRQMDSPNCGPEELTGIMQQRQDFEKMLRKPIENPNMQP